MKHMLCIVLLVLYLPIFSMDKFPQHKKENEPHQQIELSRKLKYQREYNVWRGVKEKRQLQPWEQDRFNFLIIMLADIDSKKDTGDEDWV